MAQTSMTVRLDARQKAIFDKLCEQFGMSANTAINIFVRQVIRRRCIPFPIAADTEKDLENSAMQAFKTLRAHAESSASSEMTLKEINAEIEAARASRFHR